MPNQEHQQAFFFYVETRIDAADIKMTGAAIKALIQQRVPAFDPNQPLVLEGQGQEEDRIVSDSDVVYLTVGGGEGPKRFYSKPPATFGRMGP